MCGMMSNIFECVSLSNKDAFEMMMRSTGDSIYFEDLESRFIFLSNAQLRRLNKTEMQDAIGKSDFDFFSKEHANRK